MEHHNVMVFEPIEFLQTPQVLQVGWNGGTLTLQISNENRVYGTPLMIQPFHFYSISNSVTQKYTKALPEGRLQVAARPGLDCSALFSLCLYYLVASLLPRLVD